MCFLKAYRSNLKNECSLRYLPLFSKIGFLGSFRKLNGLIELPREAKNVLSQGMFLLNKNLNPT